MAYEFSKDHDTIILSVSNLGMIIGALIAVGGLMGIVDVFIDVRDVVTTAVILAGIQHFLRMVAGLLLIPAIRSFREVATTQGSDIKRLTGSMNGMGQAFSLITRIFLISLILDIAILFV